MTETAVLGLASTKEPVLTQTETAKTEPTVVDPAKSSPTPDEIINQKIAEAVKVALASETEKSRRELQSVKDKSIAEVVAAQRRAKIAETQNGAIQKHLQTLDPDTAKELELAQFRAEREGRLSVEQEDAVKFQKAEFNTQFYNDLNQFVQNIGVNPTDSRIDWAGDATTSGDYLSAQKRVLDSVAKIQKENAKTLEMSIEAKIKESEKRIKKDLGVDEVNSVTTQMAGGVSGSGIPTDRTKLGAWVRDLPSAEYNKLRPEIEKMMAEGKIK